MNNFGKKPEVVTSYDRTILTKYFLMGLNPEDLKFSSKHFPITF